MNQSYLSLGSNMGNRFEMLRRSISLLAKHPAIIVTRISSLYETDPVGFIDQEPFLNMVVQLDTELTALELLDFCQEIERILNRERLVRWGPRTIDLDVLLYNQENMKTDRLTIPHPRMYERAFVVIPLLEINPDLKVADISWAGGVRLWKTYKDLEAFLKDVH